MRTISVHSPPGFLRTVLTTLALLAVGVFIVPGIAQANSAAGSTITNSVTVDYDDAGGTPQTQVTASVDVTVSLVGGVAWGAAPADQGTGSGAALPSAYSITLQNTGNGSDTFTITDNTTESSVNLTAGSFTTTPDEDGGTAGVQITLFGTVSSGAGVFAAGVTTIPAGNLTVADLVVGTTQVDIGGTLFTVAAGSTATQLVVTGNASGLVGGAGVQIGEVATLTYNGTAGTLSGGTTSATHDHNLTATGLAQDGNAAATATSATWQTTVSAGVLSVAKYVRNVSNANGNTGGVGGTAVNGGADTFYTGGVTGNPGDTLEYAVVITNSGAGNATDVVFVDTLSGFTTYTTSTVQVDTDGDNTYDVTLPGSETEADNEGGIVTVSGSVITVYAGTTTGNETTDTGGVIAGSGTSVVLYRVTID